MNTNCFSYVIAVAECGSISAAAKKLYLTQSALTKSIHRLEEELGGALFDRSATPIALTEAGECFLRFARRYRRMEDEMLEHLNAALKSQRGKLRIMSTVRGGWYLGKRLGNFIVSNPEIQLEMSEGSAQECEAAIERDAVDFIVYTDPVCSGEIEYIPLMKERLILVVPQGHPLLEGKDTSGNSLEKLLPLEIEELKNPALKYVLSTENHSLHLAEDNFFSAHGIVPVNPVRVDYINMRYALACNGGGIVIVPEETILRNQNVDRPVFCSVHGAKLQRHIVIGRKKARPSTAAMDVFWKYVVSNSYNP